MRSFDDSSEVRVKNEPDLAEKVEALKGKLEVAIFQA
jgi:hypothetical protein